MPDQTNPFVSPATTSIPLPGDRPLRTDFPDELRKVRTGLSLVYYGICGLLLLMIGGAIAATYVPLDASWPTILGVVLGVMMFAGQAMCLFVPKESGAKGLVTATVVLQLVGWAINFVPRFIESTNLAAVIEGVGGIASIAAMVCFVLFLRQTSLYLGETAIARRAVRTLIVGLIGATMVVPGVVMMGAYGAGPNPTAPQIDMTWVALMSLGGLFTLAAVLMYANTITYLRKAIKL